jgi:hypothetical protein
MPYMERHASEHRSTPCAEFPNDNQELHHGATWVCLELGREPTCELPRLGAGLAIAAPSTAPAPSSEVHALASTPSHDARPPEAFEEESEVLVASPPLPVPMDGEAPTERAELDAGLLDGEEESIEIVDELCFDEALDEPLPESDSPESGGESSGADPFAQLVAALVDVALLLGAGDEGITRLEALLGRTRLEAIDPDAPSVEALVAGNVLAAGATGYARSSQFTAKVVAWQGILRGETEDFSLPDGGALEPLDEWAADLLARVVGPPARADGIRSELRRRGVAAFGLVAEAA